MENLVFIEILRRGYKLNENIFYYKTKNKKEVDFILKKENKIKELIQVCYETENREAKEREIRALLEAAKELKCNNLLVITSDFEDEEKIKGKKIKFIPLWKWLLS